jgi:AcrR family transcriptional regulator
MTFYNHFKSKDELVAEYVQRRSRTWREWLTNTIDLYARTEQERPLAIFDALENRFSTPEYRGCAFINTIIEIADPKHIASQAAREHKESVEQFVKQTVEEAGFTNSQELAQQLMLLMDGATVVALREGTPTAARVAKQIATRLLASATENP